MPNVKVDNLYVQFNDTYTYSSPNLVSGDEIKTIAAKIHKRFSSMGTCAYKEYTDSIDNADASEIPTVEAVVDKLQEYRENSVQDNIDYVQTSAISSVLNNSTKNKANWYSRNISVNGISYVINNDGTVTANGTASGRAGTQLSLDVSNIKNGRYVLSGCPSGGKVDGTILYDLYMYDHTLGQRVVSGEDTGEGLVFDWTVDKTHDYSIMVDIRSGTTANNLVFKPMLSLEQMYNETSTFVEYCDDPIGKQTKHIYVNPTNSSNGSFHFTNLALAIHYTMLTWNENVHFVIHIDPGTYDISSYVTSAIGNGSLDEKGLYIMPNTKIIGSGSNKTIINYIYNGSDDDIMSNVSGLNMPFTSELKGVSLNVKNIRYAIHSDMSLSSESSNVNNEKLKNTTIILEDVMLEHQGFDDGLSPTYKVPSCWGAGCWDNSTRIFRNCTMKSNTMAPWFNHDRTDLTSPSTFIFEGCNFINNEASTTVTDNSAACSLCFISWGADVKHKVTVNNTYLNKYLTLRVNTSQGNANAVNSYEVCIGSNNIIVIESDANSTRQNFNYISNDCIESICQGSQITAYKPVSSNRWYWIRPGYDKTQNIRGIALNSAQVNDKVAVQTRGYIVLPLLTSDTFNDGDLLDYDVSQNKYVVVTKNPLLRVVGGNIAQIVANDNPQMVSNQIIANIVDNGQKNIVNITSSTTTQNGVTFTINDDQTVTLTGRASAYYGFRIVGVQGSSAYTDSVPIPKGTYILTGLPSGSSSTTFRYLLGLQTSSTATRTSTSIYDNYVFTVNNDTTHFDLTVYVATNSNFSTPVTCEPMICLVDLYNISDKFVPYVPPLRKMYEMIKSATGTREVKGVYSTENIDNPDNEEQINKK